MKRRYLVLQDARHSGISVSILRIDPEQSYQLVQCLGGAPHRGQRSGTVVCRVTIRRLLAQQPFVRGQRLFLPIHAATHAHT